MDNPTQEQLDFFEAVDKGHQSLVLSAAAGSGKSTTMKEGLHRKRGISRESVLFTAFNSSTVDEQKSQLPNSIKVSTSHSFGLSQLLGSGLYSGKSIDKNKLYKIADSVLSLAKYRSKYQPKSRESIKVRIVKSVSMAKNMLVTTQQQMFDVIDELGVKTIDFEDFGEVCFEVLKKSNKSKSIDFDDMLYLPALLGSRGEIKIRKYDIVVGDEIQDFSASQQCLIDLATGQRLFAAGDNFQCINSFRGADEQNFNKLLCRQDVDVLPLSITWRCAESIVDMAKKYNPVIKARPNAPKGIIESSNNCDDAVSGDMVIAYRNLPAIKACVGFIKSGQAANFSGEDFGSKILKMISKTKTLSSREAALIIRGRFEQVYDSACQKYGEDRAKRQKWLKFLSEEVGIAEFFCQQTDTVEQTKSLINKVFSSSSGGVLCSTIHRAKGLEANKVYILEYEDLLKKAATDSQSFNLAYVAITRAKNHLVLVSH